MYVNILVELSQKPRKKKYKTIMTKDWNKKLKRLWFKKLLEKKTTNKAITKSCEIIKKTLTKDRKKLTKNIELKVKTNKTITKNREIKK